jgi:hypothetical protein
MKPFLASLMAILLAAHAAFGCCWHHAHARESVAAAPGCCSHHHDSDDHSQPPCNSQDQCEGTCQYVAPEKVRLDDAKSLIWMELEAPTVTFADRHIQNATRDGGYCPIDFLPPLRLHLLHQLLLI